MTLRTDLTDATLAQSVHAGQHNEVNQAVLDLQQGGASEALPAAQPLTTAETENFESGGTYTVAVIPATAPKGYVFGVKREADDFPFLAVTDVGDWVVSDGTYDPTDHPVSYVGMQVTGATQGIAFAAGGTGRLRINPENVQVDSPAFVLVDQGGDPAAPLAGQSSVFSRTNGGGKTELCVLFHTGAVQVIATEP